MTTTTTEDVSPVISASHRKLIINNENILSSSLREPSTSPGSSHSSEEHNINSCHYLLLDSNILDNILKIVGVCNSKELELCNNISRKKGLANCLEIKCTASGFDYFFSTYKSKRVRQDRVIRSQTPFDINARAVIAFREIEKCHTSMETFGYMNCVPPMSYATFSEMNKELAACYSMVADNSMLQAVHENKGDDSDDLVCNSSFVRQNVAKRGYSSLNAVVSVISVEIGKVIEYRVLAKKCAQCTAWESRRGTGDFDNFMSFHIEECLINHQGSAGAMESKRIVECFGSSLDKYNLRYTEYLGDGDTNSYHDVVNSKPHDDIPVKKLECIGHIQKRVGARLLKVRKNGDFKELYEDDDEESNSKKRKKKKSLRLIDKDINKLQNYYGIAIRSSTGDIVWNLKKSIAAAFYHCCEATSLEQRHQFCPKTVSSWCKYQNDIINGTTTYRNKLGIDIKLRDLIKPVFMYLSCDELLSKCLQNTK